MKKRYLAIGVLAALLLTGCGDEGDEGDEVEGAAAQGWHFPGRDCLACHNVDLQNDKHLLFGGTLFKTAAVTDIDDLSQSCGGALVVNFLDASYALQLSSADYEDPDSKGYRGKGNLFVLERMLGTLNGDYYVQIVEKNTGLTLAQSTTLHAFNGADYTIGASTDVNNRRACNACHTDGGTASNLYVQVNADLCE